MVPEGPCGGKLGPCGRPDGYPVGPGIGVVGPPGADGNWELGVAPGKEGAAVCAVLGPGGNGLSGRLYV